MPDPTTSARASGWEWTRAVLLSANLAWTTLCLGGFLPVTQVAMAILTAALVAVHCADPRDGARAHPAGWLFIPFLAYAAANVAWVSPVRWLGWGDWLNWAQAVAVFWVALNGFPSPRCRRFLCAAVVAIGAAAAVLAAYQHFVRPDWLMLGRTQAAQFIGRSSGPFGIPNSLGVLMALLIPPVGALAFGADRPAVRGLCVVALVLLLAGFVFAVSRGAWLALAAAFAVRSLIVSDRSLGRRLAGAASAVIVAATAAAILYVSYPLMRIRVDQLVKDVGEVTRPILWRGALGIFEAHPVLGGGGGSFDALFEAFRPMGFRDRPIYAHCDYLNTLADYGAVGFILFFGAAGVLAWRCARARGLAGAAYTGLIAFALHLLVDFHLKIPALAITVATVAALVAAEAWRVRPEAGPGPRKPSAAARVAALGCGFATLALTFAWVVPMHRAEAERRGARERIDRMAREGTDVAKQGQALGEIDSVLAASLVGDPSNAQTWSDKAYADSLLALADSRRTAELGAQVEAEATRAVDLAPVVAEFWIRKGTGLDMEGRWVEGGECFAKALLLAPNRADTWYYQAYHLSLNSIEIGPAAAAAGVALRLDPGFLLAQVLRQRLVIRQSPPP